MPPATSMPTDGHMTSSRMSTRRPSAAMQALVAAATAAQHPGMMPPISMLVLTRSPMMIPVRC